LDQEHDSGLVLILILILILIFFVFIAIHRPLPTFFETLRSDLRISA